MLSSTLHDLTFSQMQSALQADGVRTAHALTLFRALHQKLLPCLNDEPFLPPLRRWINARPSPLLEHPDLVTETPSSDGWTRKFLLRLRDAQEIESVLMGFPGRFTACLSTQAGCAMGCVFCATGQMGFVRNLTAGEIVAQALHVERHTRELHGERVRNLVLMGMGEPLHNFDAVMHALDIITDTRGLNIGPARISISTVGHVPGIRRLAEHPRRYHLAISLHGASDDERSALVPANRRWPLAELMDACREYAARKKQRVFIAWTLIAGQNDSPEHARRLADLLRGMHVQVNLIPLNPTDGYNARPPDEATIDAFHAVLLDAGLPVTIRQRRGIDVGAGCGQLRSLRRTWPVPA
ncbi:MAG TPA: 23S rRNA (adenine(2503)-C(2))-methyltransferase RlmN [Verrucomicrobiales bacterium]|nr:23S rRNA (adenine(2503)-C(2))-methyltransferase RlmN [Verrucomicrobiales bacterium]